MTREDLPRDRRYPRRPSPPLRLAVIPPGRRALLTAAAIAAGFGAHRETHAGELDLFGCPVCRAYLAALRHATAAERTAPPPADPPQERP
jgi:hypothetical protein